MKNIDLKNENWKSESGEAIMEATMLYPTVFFIVGFIILFGLYEMQGVIEYSYEQYVANYSTKVISESGNASYGQIDDKNIDFVSANNFDSISKDNKYDLLNIDVSKAEYEVIAKGFEDADAFNTTEPAAVKKTVSLYHHQEKW